MRIRNEPTVFVVDDDAAIRDAIRFLMRTAKLNVETFETAEEFLAQYRAAWPGCLVLDVRMPGMSGLDLHAELQARNITLPVLIVTGHGDVPMAVRAMKAGVADFVEKPFNNDELLQKVKICLQADADFRQEQAQHSEADQRIASLTPREREVMDLLVQGKRNKVIAAQLGISSRTVEAHRSKIMEKMNVTSLSEVVRIALEGEASS